MPFGELAKEYDCTPSTITRTVKGCLSDQEYLSLKKLRSKFNPLNQDQAPENLSKENQSETLGNNLVREDDFENNQFSQVFDEEEENSEFNDQDPKENFQEVIPLISEFAWEEQKEVAAKAFAVELLPETVYMLVDKKVELESKPLKEFSQWSFLPEHDQERLAIMLFSNQRSAKRNCSRNQRVLKVPNPDVFKLSCPFLLSKGITRLIIDDCLIALDIIEKEIS